MQIKREQLWQRLDAHKIDPVYLFYGQEAFLIREAINRIKEVFQGTETKRLQCQHLYGDESGIEKLVELAMTLSFGKPKRLLTFKLAGRPKSSDKEAFASYLNRPVKDTIIVFVADEVDFGISFFKLLRENATIVRFYPLSERQIPEWIKRQAIQLNTDISSNAARLMIDLVGTDLSLLINELQKLQMYLSHKRRIDLEDVEKIIGNTRMFSVFEFSSYLGERNMIKSLAVLEQLMDTGQSSVGIIALIATHFRRLLSVKTLGALGKQEAEIAKSIGISPFFLKEYIQQARLFSLEEIEFFFRLFLKTDLELKSSGLSDTLVLEALIFKICSSAL